MQRSTIATASDKGSAKCAINARITATVPMLIGPQSSASIVRSIVGMARQAGSFSDFRARLQCSSLLHVNVTLGPAGAAAVVV